MKKKHALSLLLILLCIKLYSQLNFEILPFPDTINICALTGNSEADIFVATRTANANDGIYRLIHGEQIWECVFIFYGNQYPMDIKINPSGEIYSILQSSFNDSSLLKSTDNGASWIKLYLPENGITNNRKIFLVGNDTIFISQSTSEGVRLIRTVNDGMTWEVLFENTGHTSEYISDLAVDINSNIYFSTYGFLTNTGGVYKSVDNGLTWQFLGLQSNQVTDLEFNSSGDLLISVRGSDSPAGGIYVIYHNTEIISSLYVCAGTSGLVVNSGDDIYAGNNWQNGIFHSSDGYTFEYISPVMPQTCTISNLYLDSQEYLYAIQEGTPNIVKSNLSTITSSKKDLYRSKVGIYVDSKNHILKAFIDQLADQKCSYCIVSSSGNILAAGTNYIHCGSLEIQLPELSKGISYLQITTRDRNYSVAFNVMN